MRPSLLLRADAGEGVGNGHLMRAIAMGEAWVAAGGEASLVTTVVPDVVASAAARAGLAIVVVEDGPSASAEVIAQVDPDWVAFDGYGFDRSHHGAARAAGRRICAVDDFGRLPSLDADIVVDPNLGASPDAYATKAAGAVVLAGVNFVMLRQQFLATRSRAMTGTHVRRVLVTLGGAPPGELSSRVEAAIERAGLAAAVVSLLRGPAIEDVASLMRSSDLALTAAGTTVWELCYLGVPIIAIPIVDNQEPVARALSGEGVAVALPTGATVATIARTIGAIASDHGRREAMAAAGRALVDGHGGPRVVRAMKAAGLGVRRAGPADVRLVFAWSNDPDTRLASFATDPIDWDDHVQWFTERIREDDSLLLILGDRRGPVGMFRARRSGGRAEVGVVVAPERRQAGWAAPMIIAGSAFVQDRWNLPLDALIRPENVASQRAFAASGYREVPSRSTDSGVNVHYALDAVARAGVR